MFTFAHEIFCKPECYTGTCVLSKRRMKLSPRNFDSTFNYRLPQMLHNIQLPHHLQMETLVSFLYIPWVVQDMLNDALHNPGGVHKQVFHLCRRLCVPENGGISEISPDLNYIDSFTDVLKHFISLFVICIFVTCRYSLWSIPMVCARKVRSQSPTVSQSATPNRWRICVTVRCHISKWTEVNDRRNLESTTNNGVHAKKNCKTVRKIWLVCQE